MENTKPVPDIQVQEFKKHKIGYIILKVIFPSFRGFVSSWFILIIITIFLLNYAFAGNQAIDSLISAKKYDEAIEQIAAILVESGSQEESYKTAAGYLEKIGRRITLPIIFKILRSDAPWTTKYNIVAALLEIGDRSDVPEVISIMAKESNFDVVDRLSDFIVFKGGRSSIPLLLKLSSDALATVNARFKAIWWLGEMGDKSIVPDFLELAEVVEDSSLLFAIAQRLSELGDESALPFLLNYLKSNSNCWQVIWGLEHMRSPVVVSTLIEILKTNPNSWMRREAALALGTIGDEAVLPVLKSALKDSVDLVRWVAVEALWRLGDNSGLYYLIESELPTPGEEPRSSAVSIIIRINEASVLSALLNLLKNKYPEVRQSVVYIIGELKNQDAIPTLWQIIENKSENNDVKFEAIIALAKLGDKKILPLLIPLINTETFGFAAAKVLIDIPDETVKSALLNLLKTVTDDGIRQFVGGALSVLNDSAGIKFIRNLIFEKNGSNLYVFERVHKYLNLTPNEIIWIIQNAYVPYIYGSTGDVISHLCKNIKYEKVEQFKKLVSKSTIEEYKKGLILLTLSTVCQEVKDYTQQLALAEEVYNLGKNSDNYSLLVQSLWLIADAKVYTGHSEEAQKILIDGLDVCKKLTSYERMSITVGFPEAYTYCLFGELFLRDRNFKKALANFESAQTELIRAPAFIFELFYDKYILLKARIASGTGDVHTELGKASFKEAVDGFDKVEVTNIRERESRDRAYYGLIRSAVADGDYEEAQKLTEKLILIKLNEDFEKMDIKPIDSNRKQEMEELKRRKREIEEMKRQTEKEKEASTDVVVMQNKTREFKKYIHTLKTNNPKLFTIVNSEPSNLKELQDMGVIPENMAVLQYLVGEEELYIFVVKSYDLFIKKVSVGQAKLAGLIDEYRALIKNLGSEEDLGEYANELYKYLIEPLESDLSGIEIIGIIPNQQLYYLPFSALKKQKEKNYFGEKYKIFYINSTSLFGIVAQQEGCDITTAPLVAFANADGSLPEAETEVKNISNLYPEAWTLYQDNALKDSVFKTSGCQILQFATHGKSVPYAPTSSYLVLAPKGEEGQLRVEEIWGLDLKDCPLVVLSACETAEGKLIAGDEVVSLAFGFIYAGSASCVATLWEVASQSTAELMQEFHKNLKAGKSRTQALQEAQVSLMKNPKTSNPFYWAPFVLIGDWR